MKKYIAKKLIELSIWARWKSGELYPEPKPPFPKKSQTEIQLTDTHVNFYLHHFLALDKAIDGFGLPIHEFERIYEVIKERACAKQKSDVE